MRSSATAFCSRSSHWHAVLIAVAAIGTPARADDIDSETPTFFLQATGGYSIYKSEMVQSNDTSSTTGYGFGVYAGNGRNVGMIVRRESSVFSFVLNDAAIATTWQATHLRYRWGPIFLGGVMTNSSWKVAAPPDEDADGHLDQGVAAQDFIDITTTGYGGNLGTRFVVGKSGTGYLEATYAGVAQVQAKPISTPEGTLVERDIKMGPRLDIDLGGSVGLAKWLDVLGGFRYRTYQVTIDESSAYKEIHNTTYLGLAAGWTF